MKEQSESTQKSFPHPFSVISLFSGDVSTYDYAALMDRLYPSSPLDVIMFDEPSQSQMQVDTPPSGSPSSTGPGALPLDEYIDFGSSDEEMEEPSSCPWRGCRHVFEVWASIEDWRSHMKFEHVPEALAKGKTPRAKVRCEWDECEKCVKPVFRGIMIHIEWHLRQMSGTELGWKRVPGQKRKR